LAKERRFPLRAVEAAIRKVGLNEELGKRLLAALDAWRPKLGRKEQDDDHLVAEVISLVERGVTPHGACVIVVQGFPDSARGAALKRVYKKARREVAALKSQRRLPNLQKIRVERPVRISRDGVSSEVLEPGWHEVPKHIAESLIVSKQAVKPED
jgi:hypothetical protein